MCVSAILLGFVYYRQCVHLMHKSYTFPLNSVSEGFFLLPAISFHPVYRAERYFHWWCKLQ